MVEERYCSYEISTLLKEKGFDIGCYGRYSVRSKEFHFDATRKCENHDLFTIAAPTHQMACDWIYENYGLWVQVFLYVTLSKDKKEDNFTSKKIKWTFDIVTKFPEKGLYQYYEPVREEFDSQYEATEAGLKYILKRI